MSHLRPYAASWSYLSWYYYQRHSSTQSRFRPRGTYRFCFLFLIGHYGCYYCRLFANSQWHRRYRRW